jgi:hypothetical protein
LIKRVWANIEGQDIKCICDEHHRKCDQKCKEYVVKFIEVDRNQEEFTDVIANLNKEAESLRKNIKKFETQISRSIKKFKI